MKKKLCSFWWIPLVFSAVLAFFDPHTGVLASILLLPMFVMLVGLVVYLSSRTAKAEKNDLISVLRKISRAVSAVVVPVCTVIFSVTSALIFFTLRMFFSGMAGDEKVYIFPWNIWNGLPSGHIGTVISIISVVLLAVAVVQYFVYLRHRRRGDI